MNFLKINLAERKIVYLCSRFVVELVAGFINNKKKTYKNLKKAQAFKPHRTLQTKPCGVCFYMYLPLQHKNKRAFSVRIPEIVIKDDLMFRTYSFYFCVHNLHTGGITLDYRKKTQQIAERLGISKTLVSYYIWE